MNIDHRNPRLRRGFAFVALAALLGLTVVGLSQCRMVDDTVTGVNLQANSTLSARSACAHQCNEQEKQCKRAEDQLHKQNKKACGSKDKTCKKNEEARHKAAKQACKDQKKQCKANCYNEGVGIGGR